MDQSFAPWLKTQRTALRLSQRKLAALVGVSQQAVQQWERGTCKPKGRVRLASVLGVSVEELSKMLGDE